jgi:hypothetical protein
MSGGLPPLVTAGPPLLGLPALVCSEVPVGVFESCSLPALHATHAAHAGKSVSHAVAMSLIRTIGTSSLDL